jgi:hypothetical protein
MKIQSPWMGRIKGSAGNMTGCKVYDKNVMRAKAFEVNNPNTAAQQVQRGYFADLTKLVAGFTPDQLRTLFPSKPKAMSRRNALSKQLAEYNVMDGTEKIIDFAEIDTLGNAPTMDFGTTTVTASGSAVSVALDNSVKANTEIADNYFIAALVNVTKGDVSIDTTSTKVSVGTIAPALPAGWETTDTIHAIPLVLDTKTSGFDFGTIGVTRRPVKKTA